MAKIKIPILKETISTSNPGGAVKTVVFGGVGVAVLFMIMALGKFIFQRSQSVAGVDASANPVEGV